MTQMSLSKVTKGRVESPIRVLVYGVEGVGKTTFAAGAPAPIFLGAEEGSYRLNVTRFPQPGTFDDCVAAVNTLRTEDHEFQTLVLDSLDWIEPLVWARVCADAGCATIEKVGGGYGKGYVAALDRWRELTAALEQLRAAKRMGIVAIAHSHIRPFSNPEGPDYDRFELKLHKAASGLWREWVDVVGFAKYEEFVEITDDGAKATSSGKRILCTQRRPSYDAKTRYAIPEKLPLEWSAMAESIAAGEDAEHKRRIDELPALIDRLPATERSGAKSRFEKVKTSPSQLAELEAKVKSKLEPKE